VQLTGESDGSSGDCGGDGGINANAMHTGYQRAMGAGVTHRTNRKYAGAERQLDPCLQLGWSDSGIHGGTGDGDRGMKITFLLTPRLMVIISACTASCVLLLLMLGFELGLRQAHEDYLAQAKARGEVVYSTPKTLPSKASAQSGAGTAGGGSVAQSGSPTMLQEAP
jgi:hypothetical protein